MSQSGSRAQRSIVVIAAMVLLVLALIYAGIAALFVVLMAQPRHSIIRAGEFRLYSEFGVYGIPIFGLLCLLSTYAGLAAIWRWPRWAPIGQAAGWATIGLSVYGFWMVLNVFVPGLPHFPVPVGVNLPIDIAVVIGVIGIFVLWATRKPTEKNP